MDPLGRRCGKGLGTRSARDPPSRRPAIDFSAEFSVIVCRWADGRHVFWDFAENEHGEGILRRSSVPCSDDRSAARSREAREAAIAHRRGARAMSVCSTVEFFASREGPLVNEIAPRVHNSGHWTIEGAVTSQFEQHIRAICDLPPGSTALVGRGAVMDNLIGDDVNRWPELVAEPGLHVHIYGKGEARPGRKMGHTSPSGALGRLRSPRPAFPRHRAATSPWRHRRSRPRSASMDRSRSGRLIEIGRRERPVAAGERIIIIVGPVKRQDPHPGRRAISRSFRNCPEARALRCSPLGRAPEGAVPLVVRSSRMSASADWIDAPVLSVCTGAKTSSGTVSRTGETCEPA